MADGGTPNARYEAGFPSSYNAAPPHAQHADQEIYAAGPRLRDWARYLAKNSSIVKACLDARQAKGVGCGLTYEPMVRNRAGELLEDLNARIREIHDEWSRAVDVTGELSRQEVERLVWRDWDTAGEVFIRQVVRGRTPDRLGYQLQLIRSELVPYGWYTGSDSRMGIERDQWGVPLNYYVWPQDPSSAYFVQQMEPIRVPASQMMHLRRQEELDPDPRRYVASRRHFSRVRYCRVPGQSPSRGTSQRKSVCVDHSVG